MRDESARGRHEHEHARGAWCFQYECHAMDCFSLHYPHAFRVEPAE